MVSVREIPRSSTPPGGYGDPSSARHERQMPAPVLSSCDDALDEGVPDLRGLWRAVEVRVGGDLAARSDDQAGRMWDHVERIEQAGSRVVITGGGVVHDFFSCDGTEENGLHDVMASDFLTPLVVSAAYESGVLVLRPVGLPGIEVKRWRQGDELIFEYSLFFTVRLQRVQG